MVMIAKKIQSHHVNGWSNLDHRRGIVSRYLRRYFRGIVLTELHSMHAAAGDLSEVDVLRIAGCIIQQDLLGYNLR